MYHSMLGFAVRRDLGHRDRNNMARMLEGDTGELVRDLGICSEDIVPHKRQEGRVVVGGCPSSAPFMTVHRAEGNKAIGE